MRSALTTGLWLATISHLVIEICGNFLPVLYPVIMPRMGLTFTQVGVIALVATTATTLAQPVFGVVSDRWGANRLAAFAVIWIGLMMGLVGFAGSYGLLLLLIALGSLGSAAYHPPAAVLAATHSGPNRGAGLSIFSVGGSVGSAISPLWVGFILATVGLAGTALFIPLGLAMGLVTFAGLRRLRAQSAGAGSRPQSTPGVTPGFLTGLLLVVFAMMFRSWFQVALSTYLPTWIEQTGGDLTTGGRLLALMLFAVSAGSLVGGPAGDRVGHWRVVLVAALVMPVGLWLFLQSTGGAQLLWLAVIGVAIGATYPTSIVLALESWPHQVGFASALVMGVGWWPGGVGASVTGYLADQHSLAVGLQSLLLAPLLTALCILAYAYAVRRHTPPVAQPAEP